MNQVDIWHLDLNKALKFSTNSLSANEKEKARSFVNAVDKNNYISSHIFLREVLSSYFLDIKPKEWKFEGNKYGKPFISSSHNLEFYFNLSHTKSDAYIIFSKEYECGIDIEESNNLEISEGMAKLVFTDNELEEFLKAKNKEVFFYKHWTLKEAYLKALGVGIIKNPINTLNIKDKMSDNLLQSNIIDNKKFLAICILNKNMYIEINYKNIKDLDDKK